MTSKLNIAKIKKKRASKVKFHDQQLKIILTANYI